MAQFKADRNAPVRTVTVTVNSQPVEQYLAEAKSKEVQEFLVFEIRSMRRSTRAHITSNPQHTSKVERLGNGVIRCQ
jgi:hypothetical protein